MLARIGLLNDAKLVLGLERTTGPFLKLWIRRDLSVGCLMMDLWALSVFLFS